MNAMTKQKLIFPKSGPSGTEISDLLGQAFPSDSANVESEPVSLPAASSVPPGEVATPGTRVTFKQSRTGRKPINTIDGAKVQMVIDTALLKGLRLKAVESETTISKIVEGLIREFLRS